MSFSITKSSKAAHIARRKEEEKAKNTPLINVCKVIHHVVGYNTVSLNNRYLLVIQTSKGEVVYELIADENAFDYVFDMDNALLFVSSTCKRVMITIDPFSLVLNLVEY